MPAGSLSRLETALLYGADAVYAGTPDLSLRSQSSFSLEELAEGVRLTHALGKRIYLTLNLFAHNRDIEKLPEFLATVRQLAPDGLIVADPGVFQFVREHAPELELHVSTQANVVSWMTVEHWRRLGASLCVLAREVSFQDLTEIRQRCPDIKLETFVHGAMCMTYSGRCLLSNYMAERGSNQGSCAHSCRWKYQLKVRRKDGTTEHLEITDENFDQYQFFLEEEFRPGELYPIEEDERGSYILNSRDLCLMPKLNEYLDLGVDSLKVEGRNKNEFYLAVVTRAYRQAIDAYLAVPDSWTPDPYMAELDTSRSRGYTLGFHEGRLSNLAHDYDNGQSLSAFEFAGFVREWRGSPGSKEESLVLEVRNRLQPGDIIEFLIPSSMDVVRVRLYDFEDAATGEVKATISAGHGLAIRIPIHAFHNEHPGSLRERLPALSVGRKRSLLTADQQRSLGENRRSHQAELGLVDPASLRRSGGPDREGPRPAPKLGVEGCCGLGCNGCLVFWHEPKFARAREKLHAQGIGRRLDSRV
jgi:putative protease